VNREAALERTGKLIDDFDIAVAAIALAHSARVITAARPASDSGMR
jgi:predicted nucleic acid-binding protein